MKYYKFLITQLENGLVVIVYKNQPEKIFYTALNKQLYLAVEECKSYLSSFNNITYDLDDFLKAYLERRR